MRFYFEFFSALQARLRTDTALIRKFTMPSQVKPSKLMRKFKRCSGVKAFITQN